VATRESHQSIARRLARRVAQIEARVRKTPRDPSKSTEHCTQNVNNL